MSNDSSNESVVEVASSTGSQVVVNLPATTAYPVSPTNEGPVLPAGMECGFKNLYSGPEDKRGRYKWLETIPDDLGKPAEDKESAKWALIVRHVKVFNDPRKVLKIHSIVIQSPLLKKLLKKVLEGYPGVTTSLQRLEFSGRFEPLIHRWPQLKKAIANEKNEETKKHAELLYDVLEKEFKDVIEEAMDMWENRVITYELLWTLFQPGNTVYARQDGQETALKLVSGKYGRNNDGVCVFWLTCQLVDFNGSQWGTQRLNLSIMTYNGTMQIQKLSAYPIEYHPKSEEIQERLIERGGRVEALAGNHYKAYSGIGWRKGQFGQKDRFNIKGRVVIDTASWNRFNPNSNVYVTSLGHSGIDAAAGLGSGQNDDDGGDNDDNDSDGYNSYDDEDESGMPLDGYFPDDDEDQPQRTPLTKEQKLLCTPLLRGYALKEKQWLNLFVNCVHEIEFSSAAFEALVLPSDQKELILGFTEQQRSVSKFDDVIEGKGKGIIMLLCGPPGVGKTLTAESVAEEMKAPLYMMSAGDLGLEPRTVEQKLSNILEMCTKWKAILLIDEADVFLEARSLHELERNKLVSIFLRILEYYEGIMFLTTNRVQAFDAAFQSRIHISLDYPDLSAESRKTVWQNFLKSMPSSVEHSISERELEKLALIEINGRQIKNALKTAQLLARKRVQKLGFEHVKTVLDVTQHLHKATRETDQQRSAIFM
ncbi:MAG: hypothetical protein M1828_003715 [Chrysothrix sp. TS-e1954]|nr:MAG: hypothetical protein M1828_003715 [Chrysothrix sp. TS-e1954]